MKKLHAMIILDGFGIAADTSVSAIDKVGIPVIRKYMSEYPTVAIGASGMDVGLPDGQMGNSEVGHLNIGAGRVVYQELTRITKAIADGDFFENEALLHAVRSAKEKGKKLHLMGLLSDGGVHSHIEHLYGLLSLAKKEGLSEVYVHCFMDGRDVSPVSGAGYLSALQAKMAELGVGKIATVSGRYYAMDRDNRWERVQKAYDCLTGAKAELTDDPVGYVQASYKDGVTDEFIVPVKNTLADGAVQREDSVIFFNFRPDRAREMTRALTQEAFDGFSRELLNLTYVCMTQYDATFKGIEIAFKPQSLVNTLGEYLAAQGKKQLRIAETEKYAHVTFFFNGGVEAPNANEDRTLVASPKVATYDLQPEMSAYEVTVKAIAAVQSGEYDVMILNFANCDMVGHTGVMEAAEKAVATVDECVGTLLQTILSMGGMAIVTADHGNADRMLAEDGSPFTAHTTNPVPVILVDDTLKNASLNEGGVLADLAPTLLDAMGIEKPEQMTGKSLIKRA